MMGRESKVSSAFSWADEFEKEEQEAAAERSYQPQKKPNPFGSARPREVVLRDKGIDWRQLDLHLQQSSPSLFVARNSKQPVRSPIPTVTVSSNPQVISTPQFSPILLVPPLRYPPKYVAGILYEHWASIIPNASGYQHFKLEKENGYSEGRKFHKLKSESALCEIGNTGRRTSELFEAKEAQQEGINLERKGIFWISAIIKVLHADEVNKT